MLQRHCILQQFADETLLTATKTRPMLTAVTFLGGAHSWDTAQSGPLHWSPLSDMSFSALLQGRFQEVERFLTGQGLNTNLVADKVSQAGTVAGEPAGAVQALSGRPASAAATTALMSCCIEQLGNHFPGSSPALSCPSLGQCCWSGATFQHGKECRRSLESPSQLWPLAPT